MGRDEGVPADAAKATDDDDEGVTVNFFD